jgi:cell filamentation protein, protein adenylyltransferase
MTRTRSRALPVTKHMKYMKSHPWLTFEVDLREAPPSFWVVLGECQSKCEHLANVPLRPDIATKLHEVYLAKGLWGTTNIEGNTLTEEEVLRHIQGKLELPPTKEYLKQEIDNILQECNKMLEVIQSGACLILSTGRIEKINGAVLDGLSLEDGVVAGEIRKHEVGVMRYRGAPPQECGHLFDRLCAWLNGEDFKAQAAFTETHMAILKAIIAHLYIEWIHGFGDGNGRTGRLVEVQILLSAGVPSPACHLLSNHYNQTRREYLNQLRIASESGGKVLPFLTYALNGFAEGLRSQLVYVRRLQIENAWLNYVHDFFRQLRKTDAADRQKDLLLDIFQSGKETISISELAELTPRTAKAYAGMHPRTKVRDVLSLVQYGLLERQGDGVKINEEVISRFLPIKAKIPTSSQVQPPA